MNDHSRALRLEYFTVSYNLLEAAVSIGFGVAAASIALIGFGLDSIVESLSGCVLIWRFYGHEHLTDEQAEVRERRAVRLVGITFIVLGLYVLYESVETLISFEKPAASLPGVIVACLSLIVMPWLAKKKRLIGNRINSKALIADSKETLACAWLSFALLLGLGANYLFGFWQADPIAGIVIAVFLFREGHENLRGEQCESD